VTKLRQRKVLRLPGYQIKWSKWSAWIPSTVLDTHL